MLPVPAAVFRRRKHLVGASWRADEAYVLAGGQWKYLYRAVGKLGRTADFQLEARLDGAAARRLFERAIDLHDAPQKITIDRSGANGAAVQGLMAGSGLPIELRQSKYLDNAVEPDRRAVERRTRPGTSAQRDRALNKARKPRACRFWAPLRARGVSSAAGRSSIPV